MHHMVQSAQMTGASLSVCPTTFDLFYWNALIPDEADERILTKPGIQVSCYNPLVLTGVGAGIPKTRIPDSLPSSRSCRSLFASHIIPPISLPIQKGHRVRSTDRTKWVFIQVQIPAPLHPWSHSASDEEVQRDALMRTSSPTLLDERNLKI